MKIRIEVELEDDATPWDVLDAVWHVGGVTGVVQLEFRPDTHGGMWHAKESTRLPKPTKTPGEPPRTLYETHRRVLKPPPDRDFTQPVQMQIACPVCNEQMLAVWTKGEEVGIVCLACETDFVPMPPTVPTAS